MNLETLQRTEAVLEAENLKLRSQFPAGKSILIREPKAHDPT